MSDDFMIRQNIYNDEKTVDVSFLKMYNIQHHCSNYFRSKLEIKYQFLHCDFNVECSIAQIQMTVVSDLTLSSDPFSPTIKSLWQHV